MSQGPLMPKATAVWLIDNTSLTFQQIADFCRLHELEVKGIADGDVAQGIKGMDPVSAGEVTRDELDKAQADPAYRMKMAESSVKIPLSRTKKGPRYTPVSRRQDRPDAIAWLLRYHPELPDSQVMKLVGTTKPTIQSIRDRTHWNSSNIKPVDPVTLGLCSQLDLDFAVQKAAKRAAKLRAESGEPETLVPAAESLADAAPEEAEAETREHADKDAFKAFDAAPEPRPDEEAEVDADSVFASLKNLKPALGEKEDEQSS